MAPYKHLRAALKLLRPPTEWAAGGVLQQQQQSRTFLQVTRSCLSVPARDHALPSGAHPDCPYRQLHGLRQAFAPSPYLPTAQQRRQAATKANTVRPGMLVELDGKLLVVAKAAHNPGIGRQAGIVSLELRDSKTGNKTMTKVQTDANIMVAETQRRELQVLYQDDEGVHLMDPTSFEQTVLAPELLGGMQRWVVEGMSLLILSHEGVAVSAELPETLVVTVVDTPEDRISDASSRKVARVASGAKLTVPSFVQNGTDIVVKPATGEFIRRV